MMSERMYNCWCFIDEFGRCKSVWAVCHRCEAQRLPRNVYWTKLVPTKRYPTCGDFDREIKRTGEVIVRCGNLQESHEIVIRRRWFARKGMKEPEG